MLKRSFLLVSALWAFTTGSVFPQRLDAELVGYWNFDGSVEDLSGAENHGQLIGAQYSDNVPSVIGNGQSLDFSVQPHHVFIGADESLDSPTFTLAMFLYDRGGHTGFARTTSREGDSFVSATNRVPFFGGSGQYAYKPGPGSRSNSGGWTWGDATSSLGEWQHVAYVATADTMQIYIDGELSLEDSWDGNPSGTMHIGNSTNVRVREGFDGLIDNVALWNEPLDEETIKTLAAGASVLGERELPPPSPVGPRGAIGSYLLEADRTNQVFGEPSEATAPGLGQSWYAVGSPHTKADIDAVFQDNDPVVPYFQAESGITWWSGTDSVPGVPTYPSELDGAVTKGSGGIDHYTVKLEGEILIEESGPIRFLDGVDDYVYLAIDLDGSGTAGDSNEEVLINDRFFTSALSNGGLGDPPIVEVNFENIADGGEWLAIEFNMAEGGGRDHGMLYWDALDEDDLLFPINQFPFGHDGVREEDAVNLMIPDTHLRSPANAAPLLSGDAVGTIPPRQVGWEIDVNPADGTADTFAVERLDENLTTILDLDGIVFKVNPLADVSEGTSFRIVEADSFVGTPIIATEGWTFDTATGSLVFGELPAGIAGDLDGDGSVDFPDFLILSESFGNTVEPGTLGDIDGNGSVEFPDFLIFSTNFGQTASAVPEPTTAARLAFGVFGVLCIARRRHRRTDAQRSKSSFSAPSV